MARTSHAAQVVLAADPAPARAAQRGLLPRPGRDSHGHEVAARLQGPRQAGARTSPQLTSPATPRAHAPPLPPHALRTLGSRRRMRASSVVVFASSVLFHAACNETNRYRGGCCRGDRRASASRWIVARGSVCAACTASRRARRTLLACTSSGTALLFLLVSGRVPRGQHKSPPRGVMPHSRGMTRRTPPGLKDQDLPVEAQYRPRLRLKHVARSHFLSY